MDHQENYNLSQSKIEHLTRNGLEAIPELVRVILNNVRQLGQSNFSQEAAYERKKIVKTRPMITRLYHSENTITGEEVEPERIYAPITHSIPNKAPPTRVPFIPLYHHYSFGLVSYQEV